MNKETKTEVKQETADDLRRLIHQKGITELLITKEGRELVNRYLALRGIPPIPAEP